MRWVAAVALVVLVGLATALVVLNARETDMAADPIPVADARVVVTDLVETETLSGRLRYRDLRPVRTALAGTVTALPAEGDVLSPGEWAFEVDGRPVIVMTGDRPAWRLLADGVEDGADVLQLEANLVRFGLFDGEPDTIFDADTADSVERWRSEAGLSEGREIELGRIAFLPDEARVGRALVDLGQPVLIGQAVLEVSSPLQEVVMELDPDQLDLVSVGMPVRVVLPDESEVDGVVARVASVVRAESPDPDAPEVVDVTVELRGLATELDLAPVDVEIETDRAVGVLAVPVRALLALSDGGYALERRTAGGTELVGVEIGKFADGLVEVRGPIAENDLIVVPG